MNPFKTNCFIHAANVLLLVGYSVSDVLWLRLLAAASSLIVIPYFVLQPAPMWTPIGWNAVLAAVNLLHSWRLLVERRTAKLTRREGVGQVVFTASFQTPQPQVGGKEQNAAQRDTLRYG